MDRLALLVAASAALFATSALAERITIVSEAEAPKSWTHDPGQPRVVAGTPANVAGAGRDVCVNIGFLIRSDGGTSDFAQMKTWSGDGSEDLQAYVQAAAAAVSVWRFVPAATRAHPIYTSATFAFDGSKALSVEDIRARCRIADLPGHVQRAKAATTNKRLLVRRSEKLRASDAAAIDPTPPDYH